MEVAAGRRWVGGGGGGGGGPSGGDGRRRGIPLKGDGGKQPECDASSFPGANGGAAKRGFGVCRRKAMRSNPEIHGGTRQRNVVRQTISSGNQRAVRYPGWWGIKGAVTGVGRWRRVDRAGGMFRHVGFEGAGRDREELVNPSDGERYYLKAVWRDNGLLRRIASA